MHRSRGNPPLAALCAAFALCAALIASACGGDDQASPPQAEPNQQQQQTAQAESVSDFGALPDDGTDASATPAVAQRPPRDPLLVRIEEAAAAERNGFWEHALDAREAALNSDAAAGLPPDLMIELQLDQARTLLRLGRPADADAALARIGSENLTTAAARRHALLQARAAVDLGESGPAAAALQAYVDLQGLAAGAAHYERALLLDDLGRAADALNAADRALANTMLPRATRLDALLLAARSLESDGEWERARDRYREFADASPWWGDDAVALSRIASLSLELGEIDTAIEAWRTLVADFAEHPEALTALAGLMEQGAGPDSLTAALVYFHHGLDADARREFILVLTDPPDAAAAAAAEYYIALIHDRAGDSDSALLGYNAVAGRVLNAGDAIGDAGDRWVAAALWRTAQIEAARGDIPDAERSWGRLAADYPESEWATAAAFAQAGASASRGEWPAAAVRFRAAANTGADHWPIEDRLRALLWSGIAYAQAGDDANAEAVWRRAVELAPSRYAALRAALHLGQPAPTLDAELDPDAWLESQTGSEDDTGGVEGAAANPHWLAARELRRGGFDDAADAQLGQWLAELAGDPWALWRASQLAHQRGETAAGARAADMLLSALEVDWPSAPVAVVGAVYPSPWPELVREFAATDGVDPLLLWSLIRRESLYDADARGAAGEVGLTQVIPLTGGDIAQGLGITYDHDDLARPQLAIRFGSWYLSAMLEGFEQLPIVALAAYNAGPGTALRWESEALLAPNAAGSYEDSFMWALDFATTRRYVRNVIESQAAYRALESALSSSEAANASVAGGS